MINFVDKRPPGGCLFSICFMGFLSVKTTGILAHIRCLLQILLEFSRYCVDSSNSEWPWWYLRQCWCQVSRYPRGAPGSGRGLLWCQQRQIIRCKEADHITSHTLPQPISGPIQIHSSTNTLLHFTYRTPARDQVPVTSIFNLREASNEVKYFYSFIPDICFNLLWNSCNAEGDVGTVSSGGVTITVTTSFM